MNWNNLKKYKCPKDGELLRGNARYHKCDKCDFIISIQKFNSIVNKQYKPKQFKTEEDNLSALNNEDREINPQGFERDLLSDDVVI